MNINYPPGSVAIDGSKCIVSIPGGEAVIPATCNRQAAAIHTKYPDILGVTSLFYMNLICSRIANSSVDGPLNIAICSVRANRIDLRIGCPTNQQYKGKSESNHGKPTLAPGAL